MTELTATRVLAEDEWLPRAEAHAARAATWVVPHLERRNTGVKHPVEDFLFDYYSHEPAKLARWHPGAPHLLGGEGASAYLRLSSYRRYGKGVGADLERLAGRRAGLSWTLDLLRRTSERPARVGCFGLHEWAMVYRTRPGDVRHSAYPLRLGHSGTDEVVDSHPISCTHFDAFRFFTPEARPLNQAELSRQSQPQWEQPGCLHANMDLYRAAYKLSPYLPSETVLDAFELARDIRELDMRASPYDLSELGYPPVQIEEPEGKAEYVRCQRAFSERAAGLRGELIGAYANVLALLTPSESPAAAGG